MSKPLPVHDELVQLLRRDPDAYEALRQELIDDLIDQAPVELKPRLRGLQFRIDGVRRVSQSALGTTVRIYEMMWRSFLVLNDELSAFPQASPKSEGKTAVILPFRRQVPQVGA